MRLKRLELSGFKSFAKSVSLEFPNSISAVVGPNGSGKSNVADSVRWVLGEQSIKTLRGKRGEDLIFNGSANAPRLSRASVSLVFDNSKKEFPIEFSEVAIGRRVYRDGANEYLLNGSQARLRDIIELLANVGLGSSQHHIIGQGEADRILYASPKERKEMIEDALGLKIYQIKRAEAERKLNSTEENIKQVQSLQREIQPHLKFLSDQAKKYEIASKLREELKTLLEEYLSKKFLTLEKKTAELRGKKFDPEKELKIIENEISEARKKVEHADKKVYERPAELTAFERKLSQLREARIEASAALGKLEGIISFEERNLKTEAKELVSRREIEQIFSEISKQLSEFNKEISLEKIFDKVADIKKLIADFLSSFSGASPKVANDLEKHKKELARVKERLDEMRKDEGKVSKEYENFLEKSRFMAEELRQDERKIYQLESAAVKLKDELRALDFEMERIKILTDDYKRELEEAKPYISVQLPRAVFEFSSEGESETLRKKVERVKIKLEEAGGIDPAVLKEFQEVSNRQEYLSKELSDLGAAAKSLREVMKELEEKIEASFKDGIHKINKEFEKFFQTMFGGGKASLRIISRDMRKKKTEESAEFEEGGLSPEVLAKEEEGIDINVDLPRKKIRSLDMLSGGERALASIALLFALSSVHPPPFLVLDETDAALDEANSQRYAMMLEDLSKTTQLIVITHNRATMKCAGVLYGVTMGSDGISKLLSLKFEEAGALVS